MKRYIESSSWKTSRNIPIFFSNNKKQVITETPYLTSIQFFEYLSYFKEIVIFINYNYLLINFKFLGRRH
jgi:hypothetical protein